MNVSKVLPSQLVHFADSAMSFLSGTDAKARSSATRGGRAQLVASRLR